MLNHLGMLAWSWNGQEIISQMFPGWLWKPPSLSLVSELVGTVSH